MTDYIQNDIPWDDEEQLVDREPAGSDGRQHFGHLRLHGLQVEKVFEAGSYVTVPGVKGGDFNEKDTNGDMLFKGWKPGGNRWLFVMVVTKKNQEGNSYQIVKQYKGKPDRADEGHDWGDFVYPSLKQLTDPQRGKLSSEGLYCKWDEVPTGRKFTNNEGEEHDIKVWTNFQPFASQEEMEKAESEFFAQFSNGNALATSSNNHYPTTWKGDIPGMVAAVKQFGTEGMPHQEIVQKTAMTQNSIGEKVLTIDGSEVNPAQLLSEILDIPEAMVEL